MHPDPIGRPGRHTAGHIAGLSTARRGGPQEGGFGRGPQGRSLHMNAPERPATWNVLGCLRRKDAQLSAAVHGTPTTGLQRGALPGRRPAGGAPPGSGPSSPAPWLRKGTSGRRTEGHRASALPEPQPPLGRPTLSRTPRDVCTVTGRRVARPLPRLRRPVPEAPRTSSDPGPHTAHGHRGCCCEPPHTTARQQEPAGAPETPRVPVPGLLPPAHCHRHPGREPASDGQAQASSPAAPAAWPGWSTRRSLRITGRWQTLSSSRASSWPPERSSHL